LELFATLFAAAIHDFCHPGTTNAHEARKDSALALTHHYESTLESHHLASALADLLKPAHNFVHAWDSADYNQFRILVVDLVLMTDLAKHFEFVKRLGSAPAGSLLPSTELKADKTRMQILLVCAIKAADLGHATKPFALHHKWSTWVSIEFYKMGKAERALGLLPVSAFCDRERDHPNFARNQLGFLSHVCRPLYAAINHAFSSDGGGSNGGNGGNGGNDGGAGGGNGGGGNGGGGNREAGDVLEGTGMAAGRLARLDANIREWSAQVVPLVHLDSEVS